MSSASWFRETGIPGDVQAKGAGGSKAAGAVAGG